MKKPWYQVLLQSHLLWVLSAFTLAGSILDSISNAIQIITPAFTYIGTLVLLLTVVIVSIRLKRSPLRWVVNGQAVDYTSLWPWLHLCSLGLLVCLWLPRAIDFFAAGSLNQSRNSSQNSTPQVDVSPNSSPPQHSEKQANLKTQASSEANEPIYYMDPVTEDVTRYLKGRKRLPISSTLKELLSISTESLVPNRAPSDYEPLWIIKKSVLLDKLNGRSAPKLTIEQFAVNNKVCYYELKNYVDGDDTWEFKLPLWQPVESTEEDRQGDRLSDPVFDITILNMNDTEATLVAVNVLVSECDPVGGSTGDTMLEPVIPVSARYIIPITYGEKEVWQHELFPPLRVYSNRQLRFQLQLISVPECTSRRASDCEKLLSYAILRFQFRFDRGRVITSPQFQLIF